jgi:hypothetical protein
MPRRTERLVSRLSAPQRAVVVLSYLVDLVCELAKAARCDECFKDS